MDFGSPEQKSASGGALNEAEVAGLLEVGFGSWSRLKGQQIEKASRET
jgi:hypothetical protein